MIKELALTMITGGVLGLIVISLMSLLGADFLAPHQRGVFLIGTILFALTFRLLLLVREDND